jgi:hypothetical protein
VFVAYAAIPVGIGVAILKYRLYDIDVVIRKALVVAVLAAFFTAVYALSSAAWGRWWGRGRPPVFPWRRPGRDRIPARPGLCT